MPEEFPTNEPLFSDAEKARILEESRAHEYQQRVMTGGEATLDTQAVFEDQERERAIAEANPNKPAQYELDEREQTRNEKERARQAMEKIRATLRAKEPEIPDYDHPPTLSQK